MVFHWVLVKEGLALDCGFSYYALPIQDLCQMYNLFFLDGHRKAAVIS
jgi:hypothetical protein